MGDKTKIEWTDATWNPLRARDRATGKEGWHCVKISPACAHCYAASTNRRFGTGRDYVADLAVETFLDEETLVKPLAWKRPRRIFPCSMTDLFLDDYPEQAIDALFAVMYLAQWHTFQVLTKRPQRMHAHLTNPGRGAAIGSLAYHLAVRRNPRQAEALSPGDVITDVESSWPLPNVQLGVTAEDLPRADERLAWLLKTPAAVRFVSAEPLLGPVDFGLRNWAHIERDDCRLDWVIVGGESGAGARPMHPDWARSIRDDCQAAGVPFFFKQWGEWAPLEVCALPAADWQPCGVDRTHVFADREAVFRIGKKAAGRSLDGRDWNELPRVEAAHA